MNNDLISRSALLEEVRLSKRGIGKCANHDYLVGYVSALSGVEGQIAAAPAVDAEVVRHGRWIPVMERTIFGQEFNDGHKCSVCGSNSLYSCADYVAYDELSNYCPNCGAKMDGDVNAAD